MPARRNACARWQLRQLVIVAVFAAVFLASPDAAFQSKPGAQLSVQVNVVSVPVTITDAHGEFVRGLGQRNFRLWVDDVQQRIEYFTAEEEPAKVLVLVEAGPAVFLLGREHILAATALIDGLGTDELVAVASYSDAPQLTQDFTSDKRRVSEALSTLGYGIGMAQLNFYNSLAAMVEWMKSAGGKSAIIVLTTGLDSSGSARWEPLADKLQKSNVLVLPVALGDELRGPAKNSKNGPVAEGIQNRFAEWDRALTGIAAETGGHAFFPTSAKDLTEDYRRIAALLRHQYSLGFPAQVRDGALHTLRVEIVNDAGAPFDGKEKRPEYKVNSRREFLAAGP